MTQTDTMYNGMVCCRRCGKFLNNPIERNNHECSGVKFGW